MKIASIADLHLNIGKYKGVMDKDVSDLPFRNVDFTKAFEWMVDKCIDDVKPDLLVIPGDVADYYEPNNLIRGFFSSQLAKLVEANIHVIILLGNHDVCRRHHALKDIKELNLPHIEVIENPTISEYKGTHLYLFPYSVDMERKKVTTKEEFSKFVKKIEERDDKGVSFFFGHFGVRGAKLNEYEIKNHKRVKKEKRAFINDNSDDISVAELDLIGSDYVILGDYHQHQVLSTKNCFSMYCGSIEKTDMSEIDQEKGFVVYDSDVEELPEMGKCRFIVYPSCRPMIEVKGTIKEIKEQFEKLKAEDYQGAIVKVAFAGNETDLIDFSVGLDTLKKEMTEKIKPVYLFHEQKTSSVEGKDSEVDEIEEEVMVDGKIDKGLVMKVLQETISDKLSGHEDKDNEEIILMKMAEEIYDGQ